MELKPYQHKVIKDLELFLSYVQKHDTPAQAFSNYWEDILGVPYSLQLDGSHTGMKPYQDHIPGAIHVAIKVPTAGGKTFIAVHALHSINKHFNQGNPKAVVWLVPWSNLLQQTVNNLSNPDHPYREKLNSLFNNRVEVYEKDQLLQGANFNPSSVSEQLNIFVFNFSSLRIDSKKKDDRKVYQENGALESFRNTIVDKDLLLNDTDESALINVIRSLNPIVIVDESHNAESNLSKEMLQNLNPSLILDLTATPKESSNIISFVNALALKKENMVKLPVIVYNHHKKEEVITSALHLQRQLELVAKEEEKETGKYIRPIILFQAQSNIKGRNNTTFQKIKEQLVKLKIPEEQIKIKTSYIDELKGIDLMSSDCPVRYIITINALKEGWDCPNAYILASLADKSSAVDIEQILGRVLRQPYVSKHKNTLLNMSFVLTASSKFNETLEKIVQGLQDAGFSKDDYFAQNEDPKKELTPNEILQHDLFEESPRIGMITPDEDFNISQVTFNPDEEVNLDSITENNPQLAKITQQAIQQGEDFEEQLANTTIDDNTSLLIDVMKKQPKQYGIDPQFQEEAQNLMLPQFFIERKDELKSILFEELNEEWILLHKNKLLDGFNLLTCDTQIDFNDVSKDVIKVDFDESKKTVTASKVTARAKSILVDTILSKPKASQLAQVSHMLVHKLGEMYPIKQQELTQYVSRVFENLSTEQIRDVIQNEFNYVSILKKKIQSFLDEYARQQFNMFIASNQIEVKESFALPETIMPLSPSIPIGKSLYEREDSMNKFEQKMIMEIASLENVKFWHKNLSRGKGFYINGFESNHYPDFIIQTHKGNLILIETKGDHLDNDESKRKRELGRVWAEKAGNSFKYFMVFESKQVEDAFTPQRIIEVLSNL